MVFLWFFIILALLILSHEFGHFIVAKMSGIRVDEFAFGFPPRLFKFKKGETTYSFNLLPIGGYVKIHGEDGSTGSPQEDDLRSFASKNIGIRAGVIVAGVLCNLILAWFLLSIGLMIGSPASVDGLPSNWLVKDSAVTIIEVQKNTPAESAGLLMGDKLIDFESTDAVKSFIDKNLGKEIEFKYKRGNEIKIAKAIPNVNPENGNGALGIAMDKIGIVKIPWYNAIYEGLKRTYGLTILVAQSFYELVVGAFTDSKVLDQISGPIGVFNVTGNFVDLGFTYLLGFIALFSINLAVLNIIPFPALDGGRLLFLLIELIKGSPVSHKFSALVHSIGLVLLLILMFFVTYKDILKFF